MGHDSFEVLSGTTNSVSHRTQDAPEEDGEEDASFVQHMPSARTRLHHQLELPMVLPADTSILHREPR